MTESRTDLLFSGIVYCDLVFSGVAVPEAGTEVFAKAFSVTPGGVANRAVAGARLGASTALLAELGDDVLGAHIRSLLEIEANLDVSRVRTLPGRQSPVTVALTGAHDRSFITYEESLTDAECQRRKTPPAGLGAVGVVHVELAEPVPGWVAELRAGGTTVVGGVGWDSTGSWSSEVLDRLDGVDVFVPNDLEAMRYTRTDDAHLAARALGEHTPLAVVTRGPRGVVAYDAGSGTMVETAAVAVPAVDPTGAGDVFVAALMVVLGRDWPLEQKLRFAGLSASLSVMSLGGAASAPVPEALVRFVEEQRPEGDWTFVSEWAASL
ncbi:sugar/nucleoside kinase (ribokinase family) [Frondihabitans sp. PhB188]|uniref:carbohydrate kinase family protein n=1 Tax=Frondihabitans sp. PhB188 TaxID=2485200 RepID=UPI000F480EF3|nr:PfkB family carbohydrate kinase [Frondihabitans sp. PhB188]ROQ39673.1 sugar/nucleoside kinase (ribokinase family) [Frondihabitans sp. PhB188]